MRYFEMIRAEERRASKRRFWKKWKTFILVGIAWLAFLFFASTASSSVTYYRAPEPLKEVEPQHKVVVATITAYTSSVDETDDTPFITASGARTGKGTLACPPKYKFGTKILIHGKEYTCLDRMNRRYHDQERFDMWVETKTEAFNWGIRKIEVKINNA